MFRMAGRAFLALGLAFAAARGATAYSAADDLAFVQRLAAVSSELGPGVDSISRRRDEGAEEEDLQTSQDRKREPFTRSALRNNVFSALRQMPFVPPLVRGNVAGYVVQELMQLRGTMKPQQRALMDHVVTIDITDIAPQNLFTKVAEVCDALDASGYHEAKHALDLAGPFLTVAKYLTGGGSTRMDLVSTAHLLRDLAAVIPVRSPAAHDFLLDLARVLASNAGEGHMTAHQILKGLETNSSTAWMPFTADFAFAVRDMLRNAGDRVLIDDVGTLLSDTTVKNVSMAPLGSFIVDAAHMAQSGDTSVSHVMQRVAKLLEDFLAINPAEVTKFIAALQEGTTRASDFLANSTAGLADLAVQANDSADAAFGNLTDWFNRFADESTRNASSIFSNLSSALQVDANQSIVWSKEIASKAADEFEIWMHDFADKSVSFVNASLVNMSLFIQDAAQQASVWIDGFARRAATDFEALMRNATVLVGGFSENATAVVKRTLEQTIQVFDQVAQQAKRVVDIAANTTTYFACTMQGTREVSGDCASLAGSVDRMLQGPARHSSLLSVSEGQLPTGDADAAEAAGEALGRHVQQLAGALRGEKVDFEYELESPEIS